MCFCTWGLLSFHTLDLQALSSWVATILEKLTGFRIVVWFCCLEAKTESSTTTGSWVIGQHQGLVFFDEVCILNSISFATSKAKSGAKRLCEDWVPSQPFMYDYFAILVLLSAVVSLSMSGPLQFLGFMAQRFEHLASSMCSLMWNRILCMFSLGLLYVK